MQVKRVGVTWGCGIVVAVHCDVLCVVWREAKAQRLVRLTTWLFFHWPDWTLPSG